MAPQPRRQNPQRQPLTVALRKICRDYPPGAGILRELLQNADDAGASTVKFVLDTRTHPASPVLVEGLSQYQGPALLAYNDALFSEKDFESLASLGDSKKVQDKASTGKFGLGFCSVYNWTDCPSVLSGSTLLFLDPHHSWSRIFNPPGGPDYEFPPFARDEAMANHLRTFALLNSEWDRPFIGTIIRIPLRSKCQAKLSEISLKETSIPDIRFSMDRFATEMGFNGLLFLKSVHQIELCVDNQQLNKIEILNKQGLIGPKKRLKDVLDGVLNHGDLAGGEVYYEVRLRHCAADLETVKTFGVFNSVLGSATERSLARWAASEKLFPWVAIAAQITEPSDQVTNGDSGRLYSVLPLPIVTGQPVQIHGLFSISADRSRLHGLDGRDVQDFRPENWNKFLFSQMIPGAWAKLLLNVCKNHQARDLFHLWPTSTPDPHQWFYGISQAVIDVLARDHDPVWYTESGYVSLKDGLLAPASTGDQLRRACREAELRVIYLKDHLFQEARQTPVSRILCPHTLHQGLGESQRSVCLSDESKLVVLEYLQNEIDLKDLATLEIFPFEDGIFRPLALSPVFVHRDDLDRRLFSKQPWSSIDTGRLSEVTSSWLHKRAECNSIVRYRAPTDLRQYFSDHIANGSSDILVLGDEERSMINEIWKWIMRRCHDDLPLSTLGSLWLVPLHNCGDRKLVPVDATNSASWFDNGKGRDLALKIISIDPSKAPKLIANDVLTGETLHHLLSSAPRIPLLRLNDGSKLKGFLSFLDDGRMLLQDAKDDVNKSILRTIKELYWARDSGVTDADIKRLKSLCIFKEVQWPVGGANPSTIHRSSINLTQETTFVGIKNLIPLPSSPKQVFLDAADEHLFALFNELKLVRCLDELQILEELVIPALQNGGYEKMNEDFLLAVVELLFSNYYRLAASSKKTIPSLRVVPLKKRRNDQSRNFARPVDIVDPCEPELVSLYFEDEAILPETSFYDQYSGALASCGAIKRLDERLILDRIKKYETSQLPYADVASRAKKLLQLPLSQDTLWPADFVQSVRSSRWLPARSPQESLTLTPPLECRDSVNQPIVGLVWYTLQFQVKVDWKQLLGWQDLIHVDVLISQLMRSAEQSNKNFIEETLLYLSRHHPIEGYAQRLLGLKFIRSNNDLLVSPPQACRQGAEKLMPYLYNVDSRFWSEHRKILKHAKVPDNPNPERLHAVQEVLESRGPLDGADLDVAIEVARIWSNQSRESFEKLKVPDETGLLVEVNRLLFNDAPWISDVGRALSHPKLSRAIAHRLEMQPLSDFLRNGDLGIHDIDEDEFNQREEVADGIRDTLDRYTRESTFHEYLANADDSGSASGVNFLVDGTNYSAERLLTTELGSLQGPALLVHNDGVFKESDFEGLKQVGRGSKRDDPTTIGKFGRGSQTMYHWTDVPMILSGEYLLILDPLRQYLPFNYRTKQRKPGVKVKYSKLKITCKDQLAPFEGLWGFNSENDFYRGTIFRFPLRGEKTESALLESLRSPDSSMAVQIFRDCLEDARLSLLFLRNITCVDFRTRQDVECLWRVSRGNWPETASFLTGLLS